MLIEKFSKCDFTSYVTADCTTAQCCAHKGKFPIKALWLIVLNDNIMNVSTVIVKDMELLILMGLCELHGRLVLKRKP